MIYPQDETMYNNEEYKIYMRGYNHGYREGWEAHDKTTKDLTFREHYEKLCQEIRESVIAEVLAKIEGFYNEQTSK